MRVALLAVCLLSSAASAADPVPAGPPPAIPSSAEASSAEPSAAAATPLGADSAPLTFRTTLLRDPPRPCTGPLTAGASPCAVAFTVGTILSVTALDLLLPVERRLVTLSAGAPIAGSLRRPGLPTTKGPFVTGFSTDDTFIGLGRFDMRSP
jgi:hypothetical protein